ncbi:hypothetical protein TNCV_3687721 [Trichonephila clavipes]|nr:hypothetical protein TNCV_3687721 [Trichonephila clavipes]
MHIQDIFGSYRRIESIKTDWNCTMHSIITCFAQTSDTLARLTQTLARMPDAMDMIERNEGVDGLQLISKACPHLLYRIQVRSALKPSISRPLNEQSFTTLTVPFNDGGNDYLEFSTRNSKVNPTVR